MSSVAYIDADGLFVATMVRLLTLLKILQDTFCLCLTRQLNAALTISRLLYIRLRRKSRLYKCGSEKVLE